jgi:fumarate reductase flavoprotein subunit
MGGVRTNKDGAAYGLKGLYAMGEAACWDLHGFNRLGGNSLAETVTAGYICGKQVAKYTLGQTRNYNMKLVEDFVKRKKNGLKTLFPVKTAGKTSMKSEPLWGQS